MAEKGVWTLRVEGGPALAKNVELSLRHMAGQLKDGPTREVIERLIVAAMQAKYEERSS